ncbi:sensor histidine kinase [Mucilaginibacter antarcticus]|uniref:histidine kinase n=1 Tax=Mucilaginibacter antarcticus TaxID=1855725 RepID=A0ABW5XIV8_9SPHI
MTEIRPELYFRDLFEHTSDLIHILDMEGRIITVNPSWLLNLGYSLEEVKLQSIYQFIKADYRDLYQKNRRSVINGYNSDDIRFEMISKDGRSIILKGQISIIDNNKERPYTRAVLKNITAHEIIAQQQEQIKNRIHGFFKYAPVGIIVINESQIIEEWNLKSEAILGYTFDEARGMPLSELIIPYRYREAHLQGMKHFIKTGVGPVLNKTIEISALHKSGNEFPVTLSISNIKFGNEWMFIAFINDVTEKKELEALAIRRETELTQSQLLDERKTNFLTVASHELKTPLTAIKGYAQIAHKVSEVNAYDKIKPYLSKIDAHTNKITHLISELMDLSKIETGKLRINKQPIEFGKFLSEIIDSSRQIIPKHTIILVKSTDVILEIDSSRIEQVVNNLISNAEKYSEPGTTIEISSYIKEEFLIVQVTDHGIGLAEENLEIIFDRFFRVEEITNHINGFGIGLSICSEIIKQHNGHIWVESTLSKGATFSFSLPLKAE